MSLLRLALWNASGNAFRSWVVFLCALFVSGFALATTLVIRGAEQSLDLANRRLGADLLVLPEGTGGRVENALLMGKPTTVWMSRDAADKIAKIPGVQVATPQLYLGTMVDAPCCAVSEMFMIAYDPASDFTVTPWLERELGRKLNTGEAVGGTYVFTPQGADAIEIYGSYVKLMGNLEPTGTGLDQTMFITFDTAYEIANTSATAAVMPMEIPMNSISAVLVRLRPGYLAQNVALDISKQVAYVDAIPSPNLFQAYRKQVAGLIGTVGIILSVALALSIVVIGLTYAMAVNERRRQMGVLRALGATRGAVFVAVLAEANLLAVAGGLAGLGVAALGVYLFRNFLIDTLGVPFLLPTLPMLAVVAAGFLGVTIASVSVATLLPAYQISRLEPAVAMRD